MNPLRDQIAGMQPPKPDGFNPYAAGDKKYGLSGRSNATSGPVSAQGMQGYNDRDMQARARKQAMMNLLEQSKNQQFMPGMMMGGNL